MYLPHYLLFADFLFLLIFQFAYVDLFLEIFQVFERSFVIRAVTFLSKSSIPPSIRSIRCMLQTSIDQFKTTLFQTLFSPYMCVAVAYGIGKTDGDSYDCAVDGSFFDSWKRLLMKSSPKPAKKPSECEVIFACHCTLNVTC